MTKKSKRRKRGQKQSLAAKPPTSSRTRREGRPKPKLDEAAHGSRVRFELMAPLVALSGLGLALIVLFVPRGPAILSLMLALLGLCGLFSPETPIAKTLRLSKLLTARGLEILHRRYTTGLGILATGALFILIYGWTLAEHVLTAAMVGTTSIILLPLAWLIAAKHRNPGASKELVRRMVNLSFGLLGALVVPAIVASSAVTERQAQHWFHSIQSSGVFTDPLMDGAETGSDYRLRIERQFVLGTAVSKLDFIRRHRQLPISPWGRHDWRDQDALYRLNCDDLGAYPDLRNAIVQEECGVLIKGDTEFLRRAFGGMPVSEQFTSVILQASLADNAAREVFSFRRAWASFEHASDPTYAVAYRQVLEKRFERRSSGLFATSGMLAASLLSNFSEDLARAAVVSRLSFGLLTVWLVGISLSAAKLGVAAFAMLGCLYAARRVSGYNAIHDSTHDGGTPLIIIVVTLLSFMLALMTL